MFIDTTSRPGFTVRVLDSNFISEKPGRRETLIKMMAESFSQAEPLTRFLGIGTETLSDKFVQFVVDKAIDDAISLVCTENSADDRIVAAMLNEDFFDTVNPDEEATEAIVEGIPELIPILAMLEELETGFVNKRFPDGLEPGQVLHAFMGCTHWSARGKGIASFLRSLTAKFAQEKGFSSVCVEPTNPATIHVWVNKLGGSIEARITTKDFEMPDGTKPFMRGDGSFERDTIIVLLEL